MTSEAAEPQGEAADGRGAGSGSDHGGGDFALRMDPARSACVLIGVDDYTYLPKLTSVPRSLAALEEALADESIWGVPESRRWAVPNPQTQWELTDPIRAAAELADDTLLIYYLGHGLLDSQDDQLYLTLPDSKKGRSERALPYETLRRILGDARDSVRRRVLILDCCYSGQVLERMSAEEALTDSLLAIEGSYVLTSTAENRRAVARHKTFTAFTGEVVQVLRAGDPARPQQRHLTLNQIHDAVRRALVEQNLPEPQRQDRNGVGDLLFVRNRLLPPGAPRPWGLLLELAAARHSGGRRGRGGDGLLDRRGAVAGAERPERAGRRTRPAQDGGGPLRSGERRVAAQRLRRAQQGGV